jgi:Ctr copper transporter family
LDPIHERYPSIHPLLYEFWFIKEARQDMSGHSSDSPGHMASAFVNSQHTPLYSLNWIPNSAGGYAGTCIFLIVLASTLRCLFALKAVLEQRWLAKARNRRYIVVKGKGSEAGKIESDPTAKTGALISTHGVEENVKIVRSDGRGAVPFRLSVDVIRAGLVMVIAGVAYLL